MIYFMLLRIKLGGLLVDLAGKVLKLGMSVYPIELVEQAAKTMKGPDVFITDVLGEPIHLMDIPDEDLPEGIEYDDTTVMLECRFLVDGDLKVDVLYTTFDHAYELTRHFQTSIEPVLLEF